MPQNVVRIDEIDECISMTLAKINAGLVAARAAGMQVELPTEIKFSMTVVKNWQALEAMSADIGETVETQGGSTIEKNNATDHQDTTQNGDRTSKQANFHNERGTEKLYSTET